MTADTPSEEHRSYPPWLMSVLRTLVGTGVLMVWVFPIPAGFWSLRHPELTWMDSGGKGLVAHPFLQVLILFSAVPFLLAPNRWRGWGRPFHGAVLVLLGAWGAAALLSVDRHDSGWAWMDLLTSVLFMLLVREVAATRRGFVRALQLVLCVGTGLCLIALGRHISEGLPHEAVVGTFYQADVAAGYFIMMIPLALAFLLAHGVSRFLGAEKGPAWLLHSVVFILLLATLVLTYSRGAVLSILAVLACTGCAASWGVFRMARSRGGRPWKAGALAVVGILLVCLGGVRVAGALGNGGDGSVLPRKAVERAAVLVSSADTSVTSRLDFWRGALRMAEARPVLGWGPATFGRVYPRYQGDVRFYSRFVHNQYLAFLAEGGVVTLGAFLGLVGFVLVALLRHLAAAFGEATAPDEEGASGAPPRWFLLLGLAGALLAGLLHLAVDVDWEFPVVRATWFGLAGLALAGGGSETKVTLSDSMIPRFLGSIALLVMMAVQPCPWAASVAEQGGLKAREARDLPVAVSSMEEAVHWMPGSSLYRRELVECLLAEAVARPPAPPREALLRTAVTQAERAVQLDPERAVNHEALANARIAVGDARGAEAALRDAMARDPVNYPGFYNTLASVLVQQGRTGEAVSTLEMAAGRYSLDSFGVMWGFRQSSLRRQLTETWLSLGRCQQLQGHAPEAARAYARALDLDEGSVAARLNLGLLAMERGDAGVAFVQFRELWRLKPGHPLSMWLLGLSYREMGQELRAVSLLAEAWRLDPSLRRVGTEGTSIQIPPDFFQAGPGVPESNRLEPRG